MHATGSDRNRRLHVKSNEEDAPAIAGLCTAIEVWKVEATEGLVGNPLLGHVGAAAQPPQDLLPPPPYSSDWNTE